MNNMPKWERQFGAFHSLREELVDMQRKGEGKLRFNRPFIIASDISQQYFCEKKVEMQYLHGRVETPEKTVGTEARGLNTKTNVENHPAPSFQVSAPNGRTSGLLFP
jgi:hypothetical protein